jgi:peptide/nickel transport system substrate-binding protein
VRMVERGEADIANIATLASLPPRRLAVLRTQYASQLHVNPTRDTNYFFLNTRLPPFDDVRVRRAVNFAVDRNRIEVEDYGRSGASFARPSCQVLPPNFPGYHRYCPYTIEPSPDGKYTGPDLAKAKALVAASGTKGQVVTIWAPDANRFKRVPAYLVSVLETLGYRARLHLVEDPGHKYYPTITDSRRKIQVAGIGWHGDYPSPSNFFTSLLTCSSFRLGSTFNVAEFCDPRIDAEIARARSLQTSDPQAAAELWRKIDRDVVDQAPWIVTDNPQTADFVSRRVGNYQYSPQWGALLDQMWVK